MPQMLLYSLLHEPLLVHQLREQNQPQLSACKGRRPTRMALHNIERHGVSLWGFITEIKLNPSVLISLIKCVVNTAVSYACSKAVLLT